jgi:superfamily I DNA/RNA helicase
MNSDQLAAVEHPDDAPLLILAAAGTGKTEVLTRRIARLVGECGVSPSCVLAVTFSNRAAKEMRERAARMCQLPEHELSVATFHSTCVRILRLHPQWSHEAGGFTILDVPDALRLLSEEIPPEDTAVKTSAVYAWLNRWRNDGLEPDMVEPPSLVRNFDGGKMLPSAQAVAYRAYPRFRAVCAKKRVVDFADLLCHAVRLCSKDPEFLAKLQRRWTHVMVDEFQDTNAAQLELVRLLVGCRPHITVVGDDSQTIHEHAGARAERILEFPDMFPLTVTIMLTRNYRSAAPILAAANNVIRNNVTRIDKQMVCCTQDVRCGGPITLVEYATEAAEARGIAHGVRQAVSRGEFEYRDVCILYRINALSEGVEAAFRDHNVPFQVVGSTGFFERAEVRDALAYVVAAVNPMSEQHVVRAMCTPPRGIGSTTLERLRKLCLEEFADGLAGAAALHVTEFKGKTAAGLKSFLDAIDHPNGGSRMHPDATTMAAAAAGIIQRSGLEAHLRSRGEDERAENVVALLGLFRRTADEHCPAGGSLADMLQHVTIATPADARNGATKENIDCVTMMSVHRSKGLEWPYVHVLGFADGSFPFKLSLEEGNLEGERRLAYVAITRAKRRLHMSYPRSRTMFWGKLHQSESRFAAELESGENGSSIQLVRRLG